MQIFLFWCNFFDFDLFIAVWSTICQIMAFLQALEIWTKLPPATAPSAPGVGLNYISFRWIPGKGTGIQCSCFSSLISTTSFLQLAVGPGFSPLQSHLQLPSARLSSWGTTRAPVPKRRLFQTRWHQTKRSGLFVGTWCKPASRLYVCEENVLLTSKSHFLIIFRGVSQPPPRWQFLGC